MKKMSASKIRKQTTLCLNTKYSGLFIVFKYSVVCFSYFSKKVLAIQANKQNNNAVATKKWNYIQLT